MAADEFDSYWEAISLQAADRAAGYATGGINQQFGRDESRFTKIKKRFSRRRSLDWVLTGGLGIVLYAAIPYLTLVMHLHSNVVEVKRDIRGQTTLNVIEPAAVNQ